MRLITVTDNHHQTVSCIECGYRVLLAEAKADLDGPAFKAYYCPDCAAELKVASLTEEQANG